MTAPQDRQPATEAGLRLLTALDKQREAFPKGETYLSQQAAQQDALAFAYVFVVEPAILAIEKEARAQLIAELREGWEKAKLTRLGTMHDVGGCIDVVDELLKD